MAELKHLPSTSSVDSIVEVLEKDAGVIIDNIVNSDFLVELNEELNPFLSIKIEFTSSVDRSEISTLLIFKLLCENKSIVINNNKRDKYLFSILIL